MICWICGFWINIEIFLLESLVCNFNRKVVIDVLMDFIVDFFNDVRFLVILWNWFLLKLVSVIYLLFERKNGLLKFN